jgi:hypothetical protein
MGVPMASRLPKELASTSDDLTLLFHLGAGVFGSLVAGLANGGIEAIWIPGHSPLETDQPHLVVHGAVDRLGCHVGEKKGIVRPLFGRRLVTFGPLRPVDCGRCGRRAGFQVLAQR